MSKIYRTAQGKSLDIEKLRLQNELVPAIGNMRVNARGDQLGRGGQIVKSREDMISEHYQKNTHKSRPNNAAEADVIPTKGGKSKSVEPTGTTASVNIETPQHSVPNSNQSADAQAPDTNLNVEQTTEQQSPSEIDPVTGIGQGASALKGGLARAVAKTREYEERKNKPKRI